MDRFWRGLREGVLDWAGGITSLLQVAIPAVHWSVIRVGSQGWGS
jgi:hypothetical protein